MTTPTFSSVERQQRDAASWAQQVSRLKVRDVLSGALNLHVEGRQVVGPLQGFGQMWQKIYRVRLSGSPVQAREVITTWKEHFPEGSGCPLESCKRGESCTSRVVYGN